ncbi:MAG: hypothetical protein EA382_02895 [Spirochaetaceae bacterium]|nr:MAG: hypothetical protein EA382_02895 [Spirochaetaceae bacterium]
MHLYLVLAVPLSYLYALVRRDEFTEPTTFTLIPVVKGVVASIVIAALQAALRRAWLAPAGDATVFWYYWLRDFLIPGLGGFGVYLMTIKDREGFSPRERGLSLISFYAGVFASLGLLDLVLGGPAWGVYELFLLPTLRGVIVLGVPMLYVLYSGETMYVRFVFLAGMLAAPFVPAAVALLAVLHFTGFAVGATVVLYAGVWVATVLTASGGRP